MAIGHTRPSLRQRLSEHKSNLKDGNLQKAEGEHLNLPGHSVTDYNVAGLPQKNFQPRLPRATAALHVTRGFHTIKLGLKKDLEWLSHYKGNSPFLGIHASPSAAISSLTELGSTK